MEPCDKVIVTPSSCKNLTKCINKTLLTPCRSVGLKRKSSSSIKSTPALIDTPIRSITPTVSKYTPTLLKCTPTIPKCTPNSTSVKKHLGSSIRDKLKKRKLDLSLKENDMVTENNSTENLETTPIEKNVEKEIYSDNIRPNKPSSKTKQDKSSSEIIKNSSSSNCSEPSTITSDMIMELIDNIRKKELKLSSLEETHRYAKKHDSEELRGLIVKWKLGCQDALREIQSLINGKGYSMSMAQVLDQFQVPYDMVNFNADCDEFDE